MFLYGFAKSEKDNIDPKRLAELKILARQFVNLTDVDIRNLLNARDLRELEYEDRSQQKD